MNVVLQLAPSRSGPAEPAYLSGFGNQLEGFASIGFGDWLLRHRAARDAAGRPGLRRCGREVAGSPPDEGGDHG